MRIPNTLIKLCLDRVNELAQEAYTAHEDCVRYRHNNDKGNATKSDVSCRQLYEKQYKWVCAIIDIFDKKEN